jgi:hypothetical protein
MLFSFVKKAYKMFADWQRWHFYLFYFPVSYVWLIYFIKSRSVWFYTASNPTLAFGGFEGEGKSKMYEQLPLHLCPKSLFINPLTSFVDVLEQVRSLRFSYPFIVKPDIGMKGILFRKIENRQQLQKYHQHMPAVYIIQELIDLPYEVSVFYCRIPRENKGSITALIQKNLLEVTGDGHSTLADLAAKHSEAKSLMKKISKEHSQQLNTILRPGEKFCFSLIANLFNGAKFINLQDEIDDSITSVFDDISHRSQFYYGRYDIKCVSINDLKEGKNFKILEFNGAGSVPNHIYTGTYSLLKAYKEILKHWKYLFEISRLNCKNGSPYWGWKKGYRFLQNSKKYFRKLKRLDEDLILT